MTEQKERKHHRIIFLGTGIYLLGVSTVMLRHNIWFSPDQFFIFALIAAVFLGRGKKFLRDWAPILLVFLGYEFFKGAVPAILQFPVHSTDIMTLEKSIFGSIPTIELQKRFLNPSNFAWYDFFLSLTYMSYFVFPLMFAFYIWQKQRSLFQLMTLTMFIAMYATFITVTFFPAMPPWMVAEKGLMEPIQRVLYQTTAYLTVPGALPTLYGLFRGNEVAAMPSMHAELPTLMFFLALLLRKKWLIFLTAVYALSVFVAVVYLGEHWLVDVIGGIIYALGAFIISKFIANRWKLIPFSTEQQ